LKQVSTTIISNIELIQGHHLICVEAPDIAVAAQPGQFVMVRCEEKLILRRPLSIHQVAHQSQIHFLFAVPSKINRSYSGTPLRKVEAVVGKGQGTLWLSQRQKDERLDLLGPSGHGFFIETGSQNLLLLAGGIGIAPLVFLAQQALNQHKSVTLLLGARTKTWLYPLEHLPKGIKTIVTTEDGSAGQKGMITDVLPDFVALADQIFACGPKAMYQALDTQRQKAKKPIQVSLEVRMGCGLGACYGCGIKTAHGMKRVCQDGPVFNLNDIQLQEVRI